jgi:hypothetical protein
MKVDEEETPNAYVPSGSVNEPLVVPDVLFEPGCKAA